jgi:hypothetical protein
MPIPISDGFPDWAIAGAEAARLAARATARLKRKRFISNLPYLLGS